MPELVFKMVRWKKTPSPDRSIARLSPFGEAIIELDSFPERPKRPQDPENFPTRGSKTKKAQAPSNSLVGGFVLSRPQPVVDAVDI